MNEVTIIFWKNTPSTNKITLRTELPARKGIFTRYETEVISLTGDHGIDAGPDFRCRVLPRIGLDDLAVLGIVVRLAVGPQLGHVSLLNDFEQFVRLESHLDHRTQREVHQVDHRVGLLVDILGDQKFSDLLVHPFRPAERAFFIQHTGCIRTRMTELS